MEVKMKANKLISNGSSSHLTIHTQPNPEQKLEQGKAAAKALMTVANPVTINGKAYLRYEDLQTIAAFFQCTAGTSDPEFVEIDGIKGYKAQASVRNKDGVVISTASAYCLREGNWVDRENFTLASMAQTRSAAKALRNAFGWVIVLSGCFEATPAEEMPISDNHNVKEQHQLEVDEPATPKQLNALTKLLDDPYLESQERIELSELLMRDISKSKASEMISYYYGAHVFRDNKWVKIRDGALDSRKNNIPD
jgi:hypothetical protein